MKFKASILTLLFMVLVAGNAFATPATSLQETTEFTDWTSPYGFEASNMGLQFGGPFNWRMGATNDSVIGSMFNSENYSRSASPGAPVISFNRGATEFYFRYTSPVTVTITMEDSAAFDLPWALGYTQPYHDNFEYVGNTSNTITYNLLDTQVQGSPEPGFGFYMSDMFSNYYTIASIAFSGLFAVGSEPTNDVVELTSFHYNPARPTPIPGAAWLLGSGLVGLVGLRRRFKA